VKISRTVETLFDDVIFSRKLPGCSPKTNFENFCSFHAFPLVELNRSVCLLWKSVHWLKGYFWGYFSQKIPWSLPSVKFGTFLIIPLFSASGSESIGMLIVKIGRTVKKLFKGIFTKFPRLLP
jgi:hypothetical protein